MAYVITQPPILAAASTDLATIGSAINEATASAAASITKVAAAAGDEVSTVIANLFDLYGQEYQAIINQFAAFPSEFAQALAAAASAYANAEMTSAAALVQSALSGLPTPTQPAITPITFNAYTALVMGGTGMPLPMQWYVDAVNQLFIQPNQNGAVPQPLFTPEQLYPITGVKTLPFQTSIQQGLAILDSAIRQQVALGNHVTVFGYSQSSVLASLEIDRLVSEGPNAPPPSQVNFVLIGNEMNPNGGILERFIGLNLAAIGLPFYGATPANPYSTINYTLQYDGFADFPQYPINALADLNAIAGIATIHTQYTDLTPYQVNHAIPLQTMGTTSDQYFLIPVQNLPMLDPLRAIPIIGNPLADLIQPDLKVIVNLGYGDPAFGYSTDPANIPTPFGLFPDVNPGTVVNDLVGGAQQGAQAFVNDVSAQIAAPITVPPLPIPNILALAPSLLSSLPTPIDVVNALTVITSNNNSLVVPAGDLSLSVLLTLPAYDATLSLSQLAQGNLINAIGYPVAANSGLLTLAALIGLGSVVQVAQEDIDEIAGLF